MDDIDQSFRYRSDIFIKTVAEARQNCRTVVTFLKWLVISRENSAVGDLLWSRAGRVAMRGAIGSWDGSIRLMVGFAILSILVFARWPIGLIGLLGTVPVITVLIGRCPVYWLMGVSTRPSPRRPFERRMPAPGLFSQTGRLSTDTSALFSASDDGVDHDDWTMAPRRP